MNVYIVQDMEGVSGVVEYEYDLQAKGETYSVEARSLMTKEINAAIEGAFEGGAAEVLVHESHKFIFEELHKDAKYVTGSRNLLIDKSFDGVFIVGQHAMAGAKNGVLAHSYSGKFIRAMYLNNKAIGEIGMISAYAGCFGVPVILVTGDTAAAREAESLLGNVETAVVKQGLGVNSAVCLSARKSRELIKEKAIRAVERIKEFNVYTGKPPFEFKIEFTKPIIAERCLSYPGVKKIDETTVTYQDNDFLEVFKFRQFQAMVNWF